MANLISPGVSVTVTDQSMYIPASATTVPLFFIATADEKTQADGVSAAQGTYESNVIRTVTSLQQSVQLYGIPNFLADSGGNPLHGDARNEYGLFALNQYLGIGNRALVIRANINLDDNFSNLQALWDNKFTEAAYVLENLVNAYIDEQNQYNLAQNPPLPIISTVNAAQITSLAETATALIWQNTSFDNSHDSYFNNHTSAPYYVYANGFSSAPTGSYLGFAGMVAAWVSAGLGSVVATAWTAQEAGSLLLNAADLFKYTNQFLQETSLGANDAARRVAIVTALRAAINSNTDILSETYEFTLVAAPGYYEVAVDLINLVTNIQEEAFVVSDTPFDKTPETVVTWKGSTGLSAQSSTNMAYYYPHGLASNLDGKTVFIASSGIAIRTITYSDEVSHSWFAPAGARRGLVTGVQDVGYVSGTLGEPTTFNSIALNRGQRDNLYKDGTSINPIVYYPGKGILVFGQKTAAPITSALDRINVVRLVQYIKRSLRKNTLSFIFEPNDQLTRDNLKTVIDSFLGNLIVTRGLYDFATVCDASNNTPDRIDRNELWVDIALKPVKAAEFIYIPIRVVATGASLTS